MFFIGEKWEQDREQKNKFKNQGIGSFIFNQSKEWK
jgi:hypothetical protein